MMLSATQRTSNVACTRQASSAASATRCVAPRSSSAAKRIVDFAPFCLLQRSRALKIVCRAEAATAKPTPVVKIDNVHDAFATIVTVEVGDEFGEMLETITALKNLGLNIRRAKMGKSASAGMQNTFYITESQTSEKIVKSARLEEIRMTVLDSIITKFPDSNTGFNIGRVSLDGGDAKILGQRRAIVQTTIEVTEAPNGSCSILKIQTSDRPGLLVDIVRVLKDVNLNVVSAEVDTIGRDAHDEFFVTYQGEPLGTPMVTLVTNALQYYLSLAEVAKEESY